MKAKAPTFVIAGVTAFFGLLMFLAGWDITHTSPKEGCQERGGVYIERPISDLGEINCIIGRRFVHIN